jgi:hypothetical protein
VQHAANRVVGHLWLLRRHRYALPAFVGSRPCVRSVPRDLIATVDLPSSRGKVGHGIGKSSVIWSSGSSGPLALEMTIEGRAADLVG